MSCPPWPSNSTEYLPIRIGADIELGTQNVEVAFIDDNDSYPQESDWITAQWDSSEEDQVIVLVGPEGDFQFAPGRWYTYVRIDAPPETPVSYAGPITVE